jgi:hypothetical protein
MSMTSSHATPPAPRNGRQDFSPAPRGPRSPRPTAALALAALLAATCVAGAAAPPPPAPAEEPTVKTVGKTIAEGILGQPVLDAKGNTIGHVVDVLIDTAGNPHAAVIEFTGFFGVGNRKVAVDWKALDFSLANEHMVIHVGLNPARLKAMPEYKPAAESVPVATPAHPSPPRPPPPKS